MRNAFKSLPNALSIAFRCYAPEPRLASLGCGASTIVGVESFSPRRSQTLAFVARVGRWWYPQQD